MIIFYHMYFRFSCVTLFIQTVAVMVEDHLTICVIRRLGSVNVGHVLWDVNVTSELQIYPHFYSPNFCTHVFQILVISVQNPSQSTEYFSVLGELRPDGPTESQNCIIFTELRNVYKIITRKSPWA